MSPLHQNTFHFSMDKSIGMKKSQAITLAPNAMTGVIFCSRLFLAVGCVCTNNMSLMEPVRCHQGMVPKRIERIKISFHTDTDNI